MRKFRGARSPGRRWRHNPLRRRSDVVEAWIFLLAWAAGLAGGTAVGVVGAQAMDDAVERQRAARRPVHAVLSETAPAGARDGDNGSRFDHVRAAVRWADGDGILHDGRASVRPGTRKGTTLTLWADAHGRLVSAPISRTDGTTRVMVTGAGVASTTCLVFLAGGRVARLRVEQQATERWGQEWDQLGPQWGRTAG
ncbi:hypothetical protein [Streptomyces spectabilis]|uniref:Integral membrane protein n=1 Tax=Streptomyces spectabilis TaxID=68270 RepID=A0A516R1B8_STRST|nr:hypothetical protein [Streptomyces spectabilis]QDQ09442.1 hypothetical protein FH965_01750 [Streptomyces spectabilis]